MIKKWLVLLFIFVGQVVFAADVDVNVDFFVRFNDPYLEGYIVQAMQNNHDLKKTKYKVEQYRQQTKISFGKELPSLRVSTDYLGLNLPNYGISSLEGNAFVLPFIASYEPDFFLKNRDKTKSTIKSYEASKQEQKVIYISLLSDVASGYINILQYDYLIKSQKCVIKIAEEQLVRAEKMFNQGVIDTTDLNSAKQNLENQKNTLETLIKQENIILNNFAVLIGISPNNINDIKRGKLESFEYKTQVPNEIKSDVIFSRPDVLKAENELDKAKIDVRIARKELLPSFNITGLWAFNTIAPGAFFSWNNSIAILLAGATFDIFKGGTKVANVRLQKAKYEELFENYRQVDLNAVKEVNTALCIIKSDTLIDNNLSKELEYQTNKYKSSYKKYERGVISFPEILSENEKLINIEQNKARGKTTRLVNYVTLYKAVGGAL